MKDLFELFKKIAAEKQQSGGAPEFLVVGLGNPGMGYVFTRHNAGFLAMDFLAEKLGVELKQSKFKSLTTAAAIGGRRVLLMKPQTYMNNSGEAVRAAADFYHIPPENILVISDDAAQEPGRMRVRRSGSDGGQKGLRSIIEHLGTDAFPRIRIGVGQKPRADYDMADWVLSSFKNQDAEDMAKAAARAAEAVECYVLHGPERTMNRFNG